MSDIPALTIAPAYFGIKIQTEEVSSNSPIDYNLLLKLGTIINTGLKYIEPIPVGTQEYSVLTEAQFQQVRDETWALCDGRNIEGSDLADLLGWTNLPDARGRFLRMKDHGAGLVAAGDLDIGTLTDDMFIDHTHTITPANTNAVLYGNNHQVSTSGGNTRATAHDTLANTVNITADNNSPGGSESVTFNHCANLFVKINYS